MKYKPAIILLLVFVPVVTLLFWNTVPQSKKNTAPPPSTPAPSEPKPAPTPVASVIPSIPSAISPPSITDLRPSGRLDYATYYLTPEYVQIHMQLFPKVQELIESHPSPQVRIDMVNAMKDRTVGSLLFDKSSALGRGIAVATVMRVASRGPTPVICFSAENILSPSIDERSKQATIYHELMHVLQFRDGYMSEQFYPMGPDHQLTQQEAADYFELEYEAYVLECRWVIKQGWKSIDPIYIVFDRDGEQAFRKVFPMYIADTQPRCMPHLQHLIKVAQRPRVIRPRKRLSEVPLVIRPD